MTEKHEKILKELGLPLKCECCGLSRYYVLEVDKGSVYLTAALLTAVKRNDRNNIHLESEMLAEAAGRSPKEMARDGEITVRGMDNILRPKYWGLVAQAQDKGNYLITPRGAQFLNHKIRIPKIAVIDKATHTKVAYYLPAGDVSVDELLKGDYPFWQGEEYIRQLENLSTEYTGRLF